MSRLLSIMKKKRARSGFAIADCLVAAAVVVTALGGIYASTQHAGRVLRMGKEVAQASELLQERVESLRYAPPWTNITTAAGISSVVSSPAAIASNLSSTITETYTVSAYPSGNTLVVTRSPSGSFTNNGVNLSKVNCVKVTVSATWIGIGNVQRSRQLSTIIAKGGI